MAKIVIEVDTKTGKTNVKDLGEEFKRLDSEVDKSTKEIKKFGTEGTEALKKISAAAASAKLSDITKKQTDYWVAFYKDQTKAQKEFLKAERAGQKIRMAAGKITARKLAKVHRDANKTRLRNRMATLKKIDKAEADSLRRRQAGISKLTKKLGGRGIAGGLAVGGGLGAALIGISALTGAVAGLTQAFTGLATQAAQSFFQINSEAEQTKILLSTALGSELAGEEMFGEILSMIEKMPFSINAVSDAFVKLQTAGISEAADKVTILADAISAFGGTDADLKLATIAIQQMAGKGVVSMEELRRQLGERIPTAIRAFSREMQMSYLDFVKQVSSGTMLFDKVTQEALFRGLKEDHFGASAKRMDSMLGAMVKLRNEWARLMLDIGKADGSFASLKDVVNAAAAAIAEFRTSAEGKAVIEDLSKSMKAFFDELQENPQLVGDFFKGMVLGFKAAILAAKILLGVINEIADFFSEGTSKFTQAGAAAAFFPGANVLAPLLSAIGEVRENMGLVKKDSSEGMLNIEKDLTELKKLTDEMNNLGKVNPIEKSGVTDALGKMRISLGKQIPVWSDLSNKALDSLVKIQEKIIEAKADIEATRESMESMEFRVSLELMTPKGQREAQLARIEDLKTAASEAAKSGVDGWKQQISLLEKARSILLGMRTNSTKVSKSEVQAAKAKLDAYNRISRGGRIIGTGEEFRKLSDEYRRLSKLQKEGGIDQAKKQEELKGKLASLKEINQKILAVKEDHVKTLEKEQEQVGEIAERYATMLDELKEALGDTENKFVKMNGEWLRSNDAIEKSYKAIEEAAKAAATAAKKISEAAIATETQPKRRANGGDVSAGNSFLVGERGMELFTPKHAGTITPNNQLKQRNSKTVDINLKINDKVVPLQGTPQSANMLIRELEQMQRVAS